MTINKHGGLTFFRLGRFGGSVYLKRTQRDTSHVPAMVMASASLLVVAGLMLVEAMSMGRLTYAHEAEDRFLSCVERIMEATARDGLTRECRVGG